MRNKGTKEIGKKMRRGLHSSIKMLSSQGITFIVLGVLLFVASFAFNMKSNLLLFAGLFFILAGGMGLILSIKQASGNQEK